MLVTLRLLAEYPDGAALSELARRLRSPRSSTHRALSALRRAGFVEQDREERYRLSYDLVRLVSSYYEGIDSVQRMRPLLEDLANLFGETSHYAVLQAPDIVYQAKVQANDARYQLTSSVGGRNPAYRTGVGKALLAYALPDRAAVLDYVREHGPLTAATPHTIQTAEALDEELARIRDVGYALDRQENELGVVCLALPIFFISPGRPDGAISVTSVSHRTTVEQLEASIDQIRDLTRQHLGEVLA